MKKINLYELEQAGIIILNNSGFEYLNQVGGSACLQLSAEGVFFPISHNCSDNLDILLEQIFIDCEIVDNSIANKIDSILQRFISTSGILVNRNKLNDSCEAWIHVIINDSEYSVYQGFHHHSAILTWPNSD